MTYFRFLYLSIPKRLGIDFKSEKLLEIIASAAHNGAPMTVAEAMSLGEIAGPATIHRKLNQLLAEDLIFHRFEGTDRRTQFLIPTQRANSYFAYLSEAMGKAVKQTAKEKEHDCEVS